MHATYKPEKQDNRQDAQVTKAFILSLEEYRRLYSGTEDAVVTVCLIGETRLWWLEMCDIAHLPHGVGTMQMLLRHLMSTFVPKSVGKHAMAQLRKFEARTTLDYSQYRDTLYLE